MEGLQFSLEHLVEWAEDGCGMRNELVVVVEGAMETLRFLDGGWRREALDDINLLRKW